MTTKAMPRKEQILSVEHINEILENIESVESEAFRALRKFLKAELDRRKFAGNLGGRHSKYKGDLKERNRQAAEKYRAKQKLLKN